MNLKQKIIQARNKKGLTQEELATLANVTTRTIQRIENGDSMPRMFTLKLIASALDLNFDDLHNVAAPIDPVPNNAPQLSDRHDQEDTIHFLRSLCLSSFSYLLIPYVHFLIPAYLLKQKKEQNQNAVRFARKVIRHQMYWVVITTLLFLTTLAYNLINAAYFHKQYTVSYLLIFFVMYFLNAVIIIRSFISAKAALPT